MTLPWVAIWAISFMLAFGGLLLDEKVHSWRVARRRSKRHGHL